MMEDNPVRVIEAFVEQLDLREMGFESVDPEATGRAAYHPSVLLKIYIYGYLNRVHSSRRLEQETQRNIELMCLTGRLMPDFNAASANCGHLPRPRGFPLSGRMDPTQTFRSARLRLSPETSALARSPGSAARCATDRRRG
jgi:hypothetical protein